VIIKVQKEDKMFLLSQTTTLYVFYTRCSIVSIWQVIICWLILYRIEQT